VLTQGQPKRDAEGWAAVRALRDHQNKIQAFRAKEQFKRESCTRVTSRAQKTRGRAPRTRMQVG